MTSLSTFAEIAALAGDPARAGMLRALIDGRALTASELAYVASITPQTASGHLARLATFRRKKPVFQRRRQNLRPCIRRMTKPAGLFPAGRRHLS